jgi:hypothetical protein
MVQIHFIVLDQNIQSKTKSFRDGNVGKQMDGEQISTWNFKVFESSSYLKDIWLNFEISVPEFRRNSDLKEQSVPLSYSKEGIKIDLLLIMFSFPIAIQGNSVMAAEPA